MARSIKIVLCMMPAIRWKAPPESQGAIVIAQIDQVRPIDSRFVQKLFGANRTIHLGDRGDK